MIEIMLINGSLVCKKKNHFFKKKEAFMVFRLFLFFFLTSSAVGLAQTSLDPAAGKVKYDSLCATCHGATGMGDGVASSALNPKPRNFMDAAYMSKKTDADLQKVIKEGGAAVELSTTMPAWGTMLSDADIANVVAYIRQLGKSMGK